MQPAGNTIQRTGPIVGERTPRTKIRSLIGRETVVIGHSHVTALQHAYTQDLASSADPRWFSYEFIQLLEAEYAQQFTGDKDAEDWRQKLSALIESPSLGNRRDGNLILAAVSGNEYHPIAMLWHSRPFDFVSPARPHLPLEPDVEIVPAGLLETALRRTVAGAAWFLQVLRESTSLPIYQVSSPPPIPDNDYLAAGNSVYVRQNGRLGVPPAALRLKLWLLQQRLFREACEAASVNFLETPEKIVDEQGYMRPEGWHPDGVHGNQWYGLHVLKQFEDTVRLLDPSPTVTRGNT